MKRFVKLVVVGLVLSWSAIAGPELPENVSTFVCSATVAASETVYTNPVSIARFAYRVLKIAYKDSSIAKQDTIDAGDAVKVFMQHGFIVGKPFAYYEQDTIWQKMSDTTGSAFLYNSSISSDSLICAVMDTTKTEFIEFGNRGDSLQVSIGYHVLVPDPAILNRFMLIGAAGIANNLTVYVVGNVLKGIPNWSDK